VLPSLLAQAVCKQPGRQVHGKSFPNHSPRAVTTHLPSTQLWVTRRCWSRRTPEHRPKYLQICSARRLLARTQHSAETRGVRAYELHPASQGIDTAPAPCLSIGVSKGGRAAGGTTCQGHEPRVDGAECPWIHALLSAWHSHHSRRHGSADLLISPWKQRASGEAGISLKAVANITGSASKPWSPSLAHQHPSSGALRSTVALCIAELQLWIWVRVAFCG